MIQLNDTLVFIYLVLFLLYCTLHDVKRRYISNRAFIFAFLCIVIILIPNLLQKRILMLNFLIFKIVALIIVFISCFFLFTLKIIGGSDGKAILLIFVSIPINHTKFFDIFLFFLIFVISFVILIVLYNVVYHLILESEVYNLYFHIKKVNSFLEKLYTYSFFRFFEFSNLGKIIDSKFKLKDISLFFNPKREKLQVIIHFRPPLFINIYLVYLIFYFYLIGSN